MGKRLMRYLKLLLSLLFLTLPLAAQQPNPANPQTPGFTLNSFDTQYLYYNDNAGNLKRTAVTPIQTLGTPQNPCLGTQTAVNVLNNFFYYCLNGTWQLISGGGGGTAPAGTTGQLQLNGGNSILGAANITDINNVITFVDPVSVVGNVELKPTLPGDPIQYVSPNGNDNNDGLSVGTAKLTVYKALLGLPGGSLSTLTAGTGTVLISGSVSYGGPVANQGMWLMGPGDPNFSSPPNGWLRYSGSASPLTIDCYDRVASGAHGHDNNCIINGGSNTNPLQPAAWFSVIQGGIALKNFAFSNFRCAYVKYGIDSNNNRSGSGGSSGFSMYNVEWNHGSLPVGCGPGVDIGSNSFWIWFKGLVGSGSSAQVFTVATSLGAVRTSNISTITTAVNHNILVGDLVTVTNVTDPTFNGTYTVASTPTANTFTYANLGPNSTSGTGQVVTAGAAAINIDPGATGGGSGLIFIDDINLNNGNIRFRPGIDGGGMYVRNVSYEGSGVPDPPTILVTSTVSTSSGQGTNISIDNVEIADNFNPVSAVEVDNANAFPDAVIVNRVSGCVTGRMEILGGTAPCSTATLLRSSQYGFQQGRVTASGIDVARRGFSPIVAPSPNLATTVPASWSFQAGFTGTITGGIAAPDGTTNAGQVSSSSSQTFVSFYSSTSSLVLGDYYIFGVWARSQTGNGYNSGVVPIKFVFNTSGAGVGDSCTGPTPSSAGSGIVFNSPLDSATSDGQWQWFSGVCKVNSNPTTPGTAFLGSAGSANTTIYYAPVLMHFNAGSISDNEAWELANNLSSFSTGVDMGTVSMLRGQAFAMGTGAPFLYTMAGTPTADRILNWPDVSGTPCILVGSFTNGDLLQITSVGGVLSCTDAGGSGGSGATIQVNGTNTASQALINFQNSSTTDGLTLTFTNPSVGNVQLGFTGTATNAFLQNSSVTINTSGPLGGGGPVSLGSSLTLTCSTCTTATINSGSPNHIAEYTGATSISSDTALDDGATTANTLTYTGANGIATPALNVTGPGGLQISGVEGSAPGGVSLSDLLWASSVVHRWEMNNNNGGTVVVGSDPMTVAGDLMYGGTPVSGVAPETRLGIGTTNQVLIVSGGLPAWGLASLTASVTGLLPIANGGCNASTAATCIANIMPTPTRAGDVPFWNGSIWTTLAGNNSGTQVFSENASGSPSFISNSVTVNTTGPIAGGGSLALGGSLTLTCPTCHTNLTTANDTSTGTTVNLLAKLTSTGAIKALTTDTNIAVFPTVSGAGTSGSAVLATGGQASCVMDATTSNTEGFYVIASTGTAGQCHAQSGQPAGVYVIGNLVSNSTTSGSAATVNLIQSFITSGGGGTVSSVTGDGALITNSATTGAVTLTLGTAGAHTWWGNATGSTTTPSYSTIGTGDLPGTGATTVNGDTCTLGSTCTVTLDQVGTPGNSASFTFPATKILTLAGTAPSSGAGGGTNAGNLLTVSAVTGGATTGSATTAGTGSQVLLNGGTGGSGSGGTNAIGGAGGSVNITTGSAGASGGTAANANGGSLNVTLGSPGTGGSGAAGLGGALNLSQPVTTAVTNSPAINIIGEYQNAGTPTFATDTWTFKSVIGTGTNGTSTLNLTHTGTSGTVTFALPNLSTATTQAAGDSTTDVATDAFVTTAVANAIAAVNPAVAVLAASTANITGTYTQVGGGVGDTFTVTATGAFSLDGIAINTLGQRVLLKNQSAAAQNGIYTATVVGTTGVSPVFTRALDYDTPSDVNNTGAIPVQSGTVNTTTSWLLTSQVTSIGSSGSSLTYAQFSYNPVNVALLNAAQTWTALQTFGTNISIGGVTATGATGTGNVVFATSPTLTTPAIGAATATSLLASGIVDGEAPVTVTTSASCTLGTASGCNATAYDSGYTFNEDATAGAAITYTLPTAAAGKQYCVKNAYNGSNPNTGTLELLTSAAGQFIIFTDGTLSATGGYVISGGAAADAACVVGVDSTHWILYVQSGTWAKH
jgi:fibronectin-binding autotransporter adhesin